MKFAYALLGLLHSLCSATIILIPRPAGPYGVNTGILALTDTSRLDPFAPKPENRSVVASVFYPTFLADQCQWTSVPAYPKRSAQVFDAEVAFAGVPNGTLETVQIQLCPSLNTSSNSHGRDSFPRAPVVIFSGGLGLSRLWYSAIAQSVASYGFTVVTIDHPYDADVVEFPNGRILYAINSTWDDAQSLQDVNVRARDASFVLAELSKKSTIDQLFSGNKPPARWPGLITNRAGIFGHSIGGATAATAMFRDSRFVGGVNLDGGLYGPVIGKGLDDPFLLFGHKSNDTSQTWIDIWPHLNWKQNVEILNATHTTFTDVPLLAELIFGNPLPELVQSIVGHVPGVRARDVVTAYVVAMMRMVLNCEPQSLLQRPSKKFPEIEIGLSPAQWMRHSEGMILDVLSSRMSAKRL